MATNLDSLATSVCYTSRTRCGHACTTEGNVTIASVVGDRHDIGTNIGNVWLDSTFFVGPWLL